MIEIDEVLVARIGVVLRSRVDLAQDLELERLVLGRRFDDEVALAQRAVVRCAAQAAERGVALGGGELPFLHQPLEAARDRVAPFRHALVVHVEHYD